MSILVKKSLATSYNSGLRLVKSFRPARNHASFVDKDAIKNRLQNSGLPDNYREGITAAIDAVLEENKAYTSNNMVSRDELKKIESNMYAALSEAKHDFEILKQDHLLVLRKRIDSLVHETTLFRAAQVAESAQLKRNLIFYGITTTVSVLTGLSVVMWQVM